MSTHTVILPDPSQLMSDIERMRYYRLTLVDVLIDFFLKHGSMTWRTLRFVEFTPIFLLKRRPVRGTIFEPFADLMSHHAHPVDGTIGNIMDLFNFDRRDVHNLTCHCLSERISGDTAARRLDFYAQFHLRFR